MDIQVRADNYHISEYVEKQAKEAANKLAKRFSHITNCEFILSTKEQSHSCELIVLVPGETYFAQSSHELMPNAISLAIPKMEKQLERYKSRYKG
ncbi:MAG: ribosome-associated translation inhibitor RaiA [Candidatus Marinimicrobia bacterium]|nr:ribosome-associated translation inhibitor RaiA [Candidatus Neomarinimicrobiota bacterium]